VEERRKEKGRELRPPLVETQPTYQSLIFDGERNPLYFPIIPSY
jgi:hypothetical protein